MTTTSTQHRRDPTATAPTGVRMWVAWSATRALALALLVLVDPWAGDDLGYYARGLDRAATAGLGEALVEYPLHALLVMAAPWLPTGGLGWPAAFPAAMVVSLLALDGAFTWSLERRARDRDATSYAVLTWLLGVPLVGATAFSRLDLVPGVLAGGAVLAVATRERAAACLVAVAAAVKLWPAALAAPLLLASRRRRAALATFVLTTAVLVTSSLLLGGLARTLSPLTWQSGRGLQVESVPATPALLAWAVGLDGPGGLVVAKSEFNAYEVAGPFTGALGVASQLATVAAAAVLALLCLRVWRAGAARRAAALPWLLVGAVLLVVVPSKVLSPQYLLWLLPVAAAAWTSAPLSEARAIRTWTRLLLAATALTQVVFPLFYGVLVDGGPASPLVAAALAVRNVLLVVLLVVAVRHVVVRTRRSSGAQTGDG